MSWTKLMDLDMIFSIVTLDFLLEVTFVWAFEGGHQQPFWKMVTRCHKQNCQWLSIWYLNAKDIIWGFFLNACTWCMSYVSYVGDAESICREYVWNFFPTTWSKSKFFRVNLAGSNFHRRLSQRPVPRRAVSHVRGALGEATSFGGWRWMFGSLCWLTTPNFKGGTKPPGWMYKTYINYIKKPWKIYNGNIPPTSTG